MSGESNPQTSKPVIQLHTIDQWFQVEPQMRVVILQNIKLKDRLQRWLLERNARPSLIEPKWVPCRQCKQRGWVELHPRYPGIHASQLAHPCNLKLYNELVGVPAQKKIEARNQLILDLGHAVHHMFQTFGIEGAWGPSYKAEVAVSGDFQELAGELMIESSADAENVMKVEIPGSPYIYEVGLVHEYKSINKRGFEALTKPKPEHQLQAMVYSAALNRPVVVYLYMNKDDSNLADFPVEFKPEVWDIIERKASLIVDHYEQGIAPAGTAGFHCQDCAYSFSCETYKAEMLKKRRA